MLSRSFALLCFAWTLPALAAEPAFIEPVWPGKAPGETKELPPEEDINKPTDRPVGDRPIIKLTNVSTPTLSVYRPDPSLDTGASVIICPGGGHRILAFDHEGTEVAEWLNTLGVTGIVLKYRVPARNPDKRWEAAVQDAQRAIRVVRSHAEEWKLDPNRIAILGFSAGGETAGRATFMANEQLYEPVDAIDDVSARPNAAALIYPAYFVSKKEPWTLVDDITIDESTPPVFFVHAFDDPVPPMSSLLLFSALKKANVPSELHIYSSGGHGYGMRNTGHNVNTWPARCGDWLRSLGWLESAK